MAEKTYDELKVSETEANAVRISKSADRPNAFNSYRQGKKTAEDVKRMFDAPFELLKDKHNALVTQVNNDLMVAKGAATSAMNSATAAKISAKNAENAANNAEASAKNAEISANNAELEAEKANTASESSAISAAQSAAAAKAAADNASTARTAATNAEDYAQSAKKTAELVYDAVEKGKCKGDKGDKGDPFTVAKTFTSVEEMQNGFDTDGITEGSFVIIASNVEDNDNAKLYVKGSNEYVFITDLSGADGLQGDKGDPGDDYVLTDMDKNDIAQLVINTLNADEVSY